MRELIRRVRPRRTLVSYAEQHGGHSIGIRLDGIEAGVIPFQIISPDQLADDVDA